MDWKVLFALVGIVVSGSFQETRKIEVSDGLENRGNVAMNFRARLSFFISNETNTCWWNINGTRIPFCNNSVPQNNVTCSKNGSLTTSTVLTRPIAETINISIACQPITEGSTESLILFVKRCQMPGHLNVTPEKDDETFGQYNSKGFFQCPNNGTPAYESGVKRTQATVCLPNSTWEGQDGLQCVNGQLYIFDKVTCEVNSSCIIKVFANPQPLDPVLFLSGNFSTNYTWLKSNPPKYILDLKLYVPGNYTLQLSNGIIGPKNFTIYFSDGTYHQTKINLTLSNPSINLIIGISVGGTLFLVLLVGLVFVIHHQGFLKDGAADPTVTSEEEIYATVDKGNKSKIELKNRKSKDMHLSVYTEAGKYMNDPYGGVYMGEKKKTCTT